MNFLKRLFCFIKTKPNTEDKREKIFNNVTVVNKQEDLWHLIATNDQEFWIKPNRASYIGPTIDNSFEVIIDGNKIQIKGKTKENTEQIKKIILNIDNIPAENFSYSNKEPIVLPKKITQKDIDSLQIKNQKPN